MSIVPSSGRRGMAPREFTTATHEEYIQRQWTFLQAIKIPGFALLGAAPDPDSILVAGDVGGEVRFTRTLAATLTFTGAAADFMLNNLRIFGSLGNNSLQFVANNIADSQTRQLFALDLQGAMPVAGNATPPVSSGSLGKVDLTAQVANIATTALSNTPPAGFYEVEVYLLCTTADAIAGTLTVTVGWTDNVGATTSTPITAFPLTATGRTTGRQMLRLASGNITYAVAVTGIYGTAAYAVYVRVVAKG